MVHAGALPARADSEEALEAFKAGRYLEAVAEIQVVLDRAPGYAYGHFLLGHCLLRTRQMGDAQREFGRALSLDPTRAEFYQGLALALNASGNWPFTVRAASEGLVRTNDPRMRRQLLALRSYAFAVLRRWSDAVNDLDAAERIHSEPWTLALLGRARFALRDFAGAIPPLRQTLQSTPADPVILRLLAESHLRLAAAETNSIRKRFDYTQSLAYAQRLASVAPGDIAVAHLLGRAALGAGQLDQAATIFRRVLVSQPRQCYALANLGRTYMAAARWEDAEGYLLKATACAPRLTTAYESLGEVYLRLSRPQEAAAVFARAAEVEPKGVEAPPPATVPVFAPR